VGRTRWEADAWEPGPEGKDGNGEIDGPRGMGAAGAGRGGHADDRKKTYQFFLVTSFFLGVYIYIEREIIFSTTKACTKRTALGMSGIRQMYSTSGLPCAVQNHG
jgi:hypothetical protein